MEENTLLYITLIYSYYNNARLYILFYIYSFIYNTYIIVTISVYNFKISPFHPIPRIVSKLQGPPGCQRNAICRGEVQSVWGLYFICPYWHVWRHFTLIWLLVPNSHRPQPSLQISPEICLRNVCFSRVCKNWLGGVPYLAGVYGNLYLTPLSEHPDAAMPALLLLYYPENLSCYY